MSQPPPPPGGYPQYGGQPYGGPPKKSGGNKTLWIVLGVIGVILLLCCGGVAAFFLWGANEIDNAIDEENENNTPREIELGEAFDHDGYEADAGWRVVEDDLGDFDIVDLSIKNTEEEDFEYEYRNAALEFRLYADDTLVGTVYCTTVELAVDDKAVADCYSTDVYAEFDAVKVSDQY